MMFPNPPRVSAGDCHAVGFRLLPQQDSSKSEPAPAKTAKQAISETIAAQAKGFTVGSMMSAATVYVFFDAQCPHCGHLWEASLPFKRK